MEIEKVKENVFPISVQPPITFWNILPLRHKTLGQVDNIQGSHIYQ